jgi:RHS repeat-associated protein
MLGSLTNKSQAKTTDLAYSYSNRGEVTDVYSSTPSSGGYYHLAKAYWENGALKSLGGIPSVPTISYGVDGAGRILTASGGSQNPVTSTSYNSAGQVTGITFGSSDSDSYQYDANTDRMNQYSFNINGQSVIGKPTWNPNGTLKQFQVTQDPFNSANVQTCTYSYDDLARISSTGCGSVWAQTFTYDPFGNITKSGSSSWMPGYDETNNHYALGGTAYDTNGNLTQDTFHTYQRDVEGHPVVFDSINSVFNAFGNLAEQDAPSWKQEFIYDENGSQIGGAVGQGSGFAYIPLPGGARAWYGVGGSPAYVHVDWLGSARLHSTTSRTVLGDTAFAPFGETYANTNTTNPYHFADYPLDFALGLFDTPFRDYHANQSRWLTPDPAGLAAADPSNPQSWNRYGYVLNDPLALTDPLGLLVMFCTETFSTNADGSFTLLSSCTPVGGGGGGGIPADNSSWAWNFTRSFVGGFTLPHFGPGSCLSVAASGFTSAASAAQSASSNVQKYAPVLIQAANPGNASALSGALYFTASAAQQMGAPAQDVARFTIAAGAVTSISSTLGSLGQSALTASRAVYANPYVLAGAVEAVAAYGVIQEGIAAYRGQCTF